MSSEPLENRIKAARTSFLVVLGVAAFLLVAGLQPAVDWPAQWKALQVLRDDAEAQYLAEHREELERLADDPGFEEAKRAIEGAAALYATGIVIERADELNLEREQQLVSLFGYDVQRRHTRHFGPAVLLACLYVFSLHMGSLRRELDAAEPEARARALISVPWVLTSGCKSVRGAGVWLMPAIGPLSVLVVCAAPEFSRLVMYAFGFPAVGFAFDHYRLLLGLRRLCASRLV